MMMSLHESNDSHDSRVSEDDSSESTKNAPPIEAVEFQEEATTNGVRLCPRSLFSFRDVTPRSLVGYVILIVFGQLFLSSCLHTVGVTETDLLEELMARSMLQDGWSRINGSISMAYMAQEKLRPGYRLAQKGARAEYPVVMVPGFVTSGLELWGGEECARKHFRQRLWGSLGTARTFFTDRDCFLRHLALDPKTGGDPADIRLRAAQGFEAADYFMATYWVWEKIINNLADVGYDQSNMVMMSYDWRLSFPMLEERDGYLTKLRYTIEAMHKSSGKKVVLTAHSMGSLLLLHFLTWVSTDENLGGGGAGAEWAEKHVHAIVSIAGPILGVPKAVPALLSGEFKDTATLLGTIGSMLELFFGRRLRKGLWITWGSLWEMLPTGGNQIWGSGADICGTGFGIERFRCLGDKEQAEKGVSVESPSTPFLEMSDEMTCGSTNNEDLKGKLQHVCNDMDRRHHKLPKTGKKMNPKAFEFLTPSAKSVEETLDFLGEWGGGYGKVLSNAQLHASKRGKTKSAMIRFDPLETPLPYAPSLKIYCMYGVGLKTERAYFYKHSAVDEGDVNSEQCRNIDMDLPFVMDTAIEDPEQDISHGVRFVDGDGTVPLLSLGYMCVDGWARDNSRHNPAGSEVITREYIHKPGFSVDDPMRSGPGSTEHVDILGNPDMTEDLLRIVTNFDTRKLATNIVSDIENISKRITNDYNMSARGKSLWAYFDRR